MIDYDSDLEEETLEEDILPVVQSDDEGDESDERDEDVYNIEDLFIKKKERELFIEYLAKFDAIELQDKGKDKDNIKYIAILRKKKEQLRLIIELLEQNLLQKIDVEDISPDSNDKIRLQKIKKVKDQIVNYKTQLETIEEELGIYDTSFEDKTNKDEKIKDEKIKDLIEKDEKIILLNTKITSEIAKLEKKEKEITPLTSQKTKIEDEIKVLDSNITTLTPKKEEERRLKEIIKDEEAISEVKKEALLKISNLNDDSIKDIKIKINDFLNQKDKCDSIISTIDGYTTTIEGLKSNITVLKQSNEALRDLLRKNKDTVGFSEARMNADITSNTNLRETFEKELLTLREEKTANMRILRTNNATLKLLDDEIKGIFDNKEKIKRIYLVLRGDKATQTYTEELLATSSEKVKKESELQIKKTEIATKEGEKRAIVLSKETFERKMDSEKYVIKKNYNEEQTKREEKEEIEQTKREEKIQKEYDILMKEIDKKIKEKKKKRKNKN